MVYPVGRHSLVSYEGESESVTTQHTAHSANAHLLPNYVWGRLRREINYKQTHNKGRGKKASFLGNKSSVRLGLI